MFFRKDHIISMGINLKIIKKVVRGVVQETSRNMSINVASNAIAVQPAATNLYYLTRAK
jgi:hypothetical protein